MLIIHGDNSVGSRELLNQKVAEYKQKGIKDIIRLDGKKISFQDLKQALESQSLFGTDKLITVENLITRPKSKVSGQIYKYLDKSNFENLIVWEQKKLTKTQLKLFKKATDTEFKTPTIIFSFLDSLGGNKQQVFSKFIECVKADSPSSVFFMISRQVRLMIQNTDPGAKIAPWQKSKLKSQLEKIGKEKVLWMHNQLLLIDERIKTGKSALGLEGELELLLSRL